MNSPSLLTPPQFEQYAARWLEVVTNPNATGPQQYFAAPTANKLLWYVSFPLQQVVQLLSVGGQRLKARLLVASDPQGQEQFTLGLFVTGAEDVRLSAYYLATTPPQQAPLLSD